ncbi:MAG TPA: LON peptidase substrate-binding domain-containing protein [Terriglobia bacterium]|nr:LON peptidase substrate-binding domain-containing protein [Terriglobia bacterium]
MDELLLPLFPLELVLLPQEQLPLHIFEDRYKQMIGECLQAQERGSGQQEFGIVLAKDEEIHSIGCTARIAKVAHRYDDGRMDILTVGQRRFEILYTNEERPYLRGGVEFFDDEPGDDAPPATDADSAIRQFRSMAQRLRRVDDAAIEFKKPYRHLSFQIAGPLPLTPEFKQRLLVNRHEAERLRELTKAMAQMMVEFDYLQEVGRKAGGNGHVRHTKK